MTLKVDRHASLVLIDAKGGVGDLWKCPNKVVQVSYAAVNYTFAVNTFSVVPVQVSLFNECMTFLV